jgi:hypothetical protein
MFKDIKLGHEPAPDDLEGQNEDGNEENIGTSSRGHLSKMLEPND